MIPRQKQFELAPQDRLKAVHHLAPRFFREVVGWDYADVLVTDDSDLFDFAEIGGDRTTAVGEMLDRFSSCYGLDGRQVASTRIVILLEFLATNGVTG
jgi:hypothetical protein